MLETVKKLKLLGNLPTLSLDDINKENLSLDLPADIPDVNHRTCGSIDAYDVELVSSNAHDLAEILQITETESEFYLSQHRNLHALATGQGAYPAGCDPEFPGVHCAWYFVEWEQFNNGVKDPLNDDDFQTIIKSGVWGPSGNPKDRPFTMEELKQTWGGKPGYEVALDFVEEAYRRYGLILKRVFTGSNGQHNIHIKSVPIAGSTIGIGWFPSNAPCPGSHVNQHIDVTYNSGWQADVGLSCHETGHCVGLRHQFGSQGSHQEPMSYSYRNHLFVGYSDGSSAYKLPKSPSVNVLTNYYGGEPVGKPWKGRFEGVTPPPTGTEHIELDLIIEKDSKGRTIILNEVTIQGTTFLFQRKPKL